MLAKLFIEYSCAQYSCALGVSKVEIVGIES